MVLSCLEQSSSSHIDDEPHAFDLTWRNYLPSVSQFCCCFQKQAIRLDDDDPLIEPIYYNDHTLYRGEALQNYLNNPRDWEFESVLSQNDLPQFVTRNPFGTSKKKTAKKKKRQQRQERPVVMETDLEDGDIHGYDIQEGIEDAEFLADDQIAHLAYNRHSKNMDQYGEDIYYNQIQGPIIQEMQTSKEFYAPRTMPDLSNSSNLQPENSTAQTILNDQLNDLTDKLSFIKQNMSQKEEEEADRTTLHTLNRQEEQNRSVSDIDSVIASEALEEYENSRRYSTGDELHIPSLADNTPFVSDHHPFSYFEDQTHEDHDENMSGLKNMLNLGKRFFRA